MEKITSKFVMGLIAALRTREVSELKTNESSWRSGLRSAISLAKERQLLVYPERCNSQEFINLGAHYGILRLDTKGTKDKYVLTETRIPAKDYLESMIEEYAQEGLSITSEDFLNLASEFTRGFEDVYYDRQTFF